MKRLLLLSNSTVHGHGYLDHAADALRDFLGPGVKRVLFVPFAQHDRDGYAARVRERFGALGYAVDSVHEHGNAAGMRAAVEGAEALFIGGGNTFRLLDELYANALLEPIRARVAGGMPYVGSSAGTGVACITIKTTNDMPIVEPPSFEALGLVPFNVNAHFVDADPRSTHMGETRETRIREFHEVNREVVVGLREGAWIRVEGEQATLLGRNGAKVFRRGQAAREIEIGTRLDEWMAM